MKAFGLLFAALIISFVNIGIQYINEVEAKKKRRLFPPLAKTRLPDYPMFRKHQAVAL